MISSSNGGVALVCDSQGAILRVIQDDLDLTEGMPPGTPFTALAIPEAALKARAFLDTLCTKHVAFDWELTMPVHREPQPLQFTGGLANDGTLFIIGAATRAGIDHFYEDLLRLNNEQSTTVRALMKNHALQSAPRNEQDNKQYDALTRLNNDLATAHRELAKTAAQLAYLNDQKNQFLGMAAHDLRNRSARSLRTAACCSRRSPPCSPPSSWSFSPASSR